MKLKKQPKYTIYCYEIPIDRKIRIKVLKYIIYYLVLRNKKKNNTKYLKRNLLL